MLLTSSCPTSGTNLPVTFLATVQANGGAAVSASGTVTFLNNGVAFSAGALVNGQAYSATIASLPPGTSTISAQYSGDGAYGASTNNLTQTVLQPSGVTLANSMMSIAFGSSAAITSVKNLASGNQEMNNGSKAFYIYHVLDNTTIPLSNIAPMGNNQYLLWSADGHYNATVTVSATNNYFKVALAHVSNNTQTGGIDASWPGYDVVFGLKLNLSTGYTMQNLKLDSMTDYLTGAPSSIFWEYSGNTIECHWDHVQYSQVTNLTAGTGASTFPISAPEPMGAIAFFISNSSNQHDYILADLWSGEPCMPRPNQAHLTSWTHTDVWAWLDRYERELGSAKTMLLTATASSDFYQTADYMFASGLDTLYLYNQSWGGNSAVDQIDSTLFPNGLSDLMALKEYCAQRGIRLSLHGMSGFLGDSDPGGPLSPTGLTPEVARWATGTLLNPVSSQSTAFNVRPDPGCGMIVSPPPWGTNRQVYAPYYGKGQGIIGIDSDLMSGSAVVSDSTTWGVSNVTRQSMPPSGQIWGMDHPAGSQVDLLLTTSWDPDQVMVDSRSDLLHNLATRWASLLNAVNATEQNYDGSDINWDLGIWGGDKYSKYVQEMVDHPTLSTSSTGLPAFGHFEVIFNRMSPMIGNGDYSAYVRLNYPNFLAPSLDEINVSFGLSIAAGQRLSLCGDHIGITPAIINGYGFWNQATACMNRWQALGPYLTAAQKSALATWGWNFYVATESGAQWSITPTRVMGREAYDNCWFNMQEWGPITPRQFVQVGGTLTSLNNPFSAQTPAIEVFVLPSMTAGNSQNISLMPTAPSDIVPAVADPQPLTFSNNIISLSATNGSASQTIYTPTASNHAYWSYSIFGNGATFDMSQSRGVAMTVTGDNSGADLVFRICSSSFERDYVVPISFSGQRTVVIPNSEVMWYKQHYGFWDDYGTCGTNVSYSSIVGFQLYLGKVPANTTTSVQVGAIQAMQEDQTVGLSNPSLTLNGAAVSISGTVGYNNYLLYGGGGSAQVYDANWHYLTALPATGSTLTAVTGSNIFSVQADASSANTWLTTRLKVSGSAWVINKPSASHEWRFESNTLDSTGTANGTAINTPAYVAGKEGVYALNFNGANQYVTLPTDSSMLFTSAQSFTISAWVKLNSLPGAWAGIVNSGHSGYGLWLTPGNQWDFGGSASDLLSSVTPCVGEWNLITAVQDGTAGTRKLYVNGQLRISGTAQDASASNALLVAATSGGAPADFLNGAVDDVRLYNQALGASDIQNLYAGTPQAIAILNRNATGIGTNSAMLNATLACAGTSYNVYACWGTANGGPSLGQWAYSAPVGALANAVSTTIIECPLTGLQTNTQYFFTFCGVSSDGAVTIWSPNALTFTTLNVAPVANSQVVTLAENGQQAITLTGSAAGGASLTYAMVTSPMHGILYGVAPNVTYIPSAYYTGTDSFSFKVNDGSQDSSAATVPIAVTKVNYPPLAIGQNVFALKNRSKAIQLTGTDLNGAALSYSIVTSPTSGALSGIAPNLTYTPANNYLGQDGFSFKVNNGAMDSATTATISIIVKTPSTVIWSASATSTSWAPGGNWADGIAPAVGDDAVIYGRSSAGAFGASDNNAYTASPLDSLTLQAGPDGGVGVALGSALMVDAGGVMNNLIAGGTLGIPSAVITANQTWGGSGPIVCGPIGGNGQLTFSGSSLQLTGSSSYSGGTVVTGGTLAVGNVSALGSGLLTWAAPTGMFVDAAALSSGSGVENPIGLVNNMSVSTALGSLTLSGAISGTGGLTVFLPVFQNSPNTVLLCGSNNYSGGTIYEGTLIAAAAGAFGSGVVTSGSIASNLKFNIPSNATFSNNITTHGVNGLPVLTNLSATSTITLSGDNTFNSDCTWTSFQGQGVGGCGLILTGSNNFLNRNVSIGDLALTIGGSAALKSSGYLMMGQDAVTASALYLVNGITVSNQVRDSAYGTYSANKTFTLGLEQSGSASFSGIVDLHAAASAGASSWILDAAAGGTLTFSGVIKASSTAASATLTKTGLGTVILSGSNTFGGGVTVGGGTLQIGNGGAAGTLGTGNVLNSSQLFFNRSDSTYAYAGVISGAGSLTKSGSGAVTLSGSNTYTGATTVNSGTLTLSQPQTLSLSSAVYLASGAKLNLAFTGTQGVKALYLNGVAQATGPYNASTLPSYLSGSGALLVGESDFASWLADYPGIGTLCGPTDAPAGDGLNNLLKYALANGNPLQSTPSIAPVIGTVPVGANRYLTLTYTMRAYVSGITYIVEGSSDLATWSSAGLVPVSTVGNTVTVRDGTAIGVNTPHRFLRLKILLF